MINTNTYLKLPSIAHFAARSSQIKQHSWDFCSVCCWHANEGVKITERDLHVDVSVCAASWKVCVGVCLNCWRCEWGPACRQIWTCASASLGLPWLPWLSIRTAEIKDSFTCERGERWGREREQKLELSTHWSVFYRRGSHGPQANVCRGFSQTFQPLTDICVRKYYTSHPLIFSVLVWMLLNAPRPTSNYYEKVLVRLCGFKLSSCNLQHVNYFASPRVSCLSAASNRSKNLHRYEAFKHIVGCV